ncbi:AMP-binding protein [Neptuniibacter sp. QD34_54]|uniref:AMP-binding protein n=1 Tax=Neptuniibacter sp. QD34_54 TaxID=3398208 RepID=UPI0039F639AB
MSIFNGPASKPRLLALHGKGSNSKVTAMQLENLGVTDSEYEIVYLDAPTLVGCPGTGVDELAKDNLVAAPWYSWLPECDDVENDVLLRAVCKSVGSVLSVIKNKGPFDGIYGFSQGAVIASLVTGLATDSALIKALEQHIGDDWIQEPIKHQFNIAIFACAAAPLTLKELRARTGLGQEPSPAIHTQTVHLIGRRDSHKKWSESFVDHLQMEHSEVLYLPGGHEIGRLQRNDEQLAEVIYKTLHNIMADSLGFVDHYHSSPISTRLVHQDKQIASVNLAVEDKPTTIFDLLAQQPGHAALFRNARERNADLITTYGDMLNFAQAGGAGDLRQLGVKQDEVVAYLAPAGGSAVAAAAFLSIAAQTCAVPFSIHMNEADALLALKQYGVKHMVLFAGVSSQGVQSAFEKYAESGNAKLHHAVVDSNASPGLFRYQKPIADFQNESALICGPDDNSLLLRTSGTTSIPKVVPLRQKELVINATVLADGIGITSEDVTYSIMPLDHIGGISASILCSLSVGASITCDGFYTPQGMVAALAESNPRPTWYSAVPTIHNATIRFLNDRSDSYLGPDGEWHAHNLRMVRSGAAALKEDDRELLKRTLGCDVATTYSMSEMMPISQPPITEEGWQQQPGAVGVPVAASLAIVDPITLRPLPYGEEGEIVISGPTVFSGYLNNPEANSNSRFLMRSDVDQTLHTWFMTGDLGQIDNEGVLSLRGRIKELIKKGGEQIAPVEVENVISLHPHVSSSVCFSVPSDDYGEEVGCALILKGSNQPSEQDLIQEIREILIKEKLASFKYPSYWKVVDEDDLPRTGSKKIIRNGLAEVLDITKPKEIELTQSANSATPDRAEDIADFGVAPVASASAISTSGPIDLNKPKIDWAVLAGFRFLLACYVMFMHIGSDASWDAFSNLRQFPWHVHAFFTLAGFTLAAVMPALIQKKLSFVSARVAGMYPLYGFAVLLALGNLAVGCQPSTFITDFQWGGQHAGGDQLFCQGTPWVQDSWFANVLLTLGIHLTGLQATPLWGGTWFLGFYMWFISMYLQCLIVFPYLYNALYRNRGNTKKLFFLTLAGLGVNFLIIMSFWYGYAVDATGYGFYDALTGERTIPSVAQLDSAAQDNAVILGFYLFAPFWMVYFVAGMCAAFLYDAIRPTEQRRAYLWGYVADAITLFMILVSIAHVAQGYFPHGADVMKVSLEPFFMRPEAANTFADPATVNRIWDNIYGRLFAPITLLWIFALSTGHGVTARVLRFNPISQTLAPTAYACFLFHQMVGQWYFAATRNGEWWNWWSDQKAYYWFSPQPVAVEWYEFFYVVGLVVLFGKLVQPLDPLIRKGFNRCLNWIHSSDHKENVERDTTQVILQIVQRTTGMEAKAEWSLEQCGLASLGIVQFANTLEAQFTTPKSKVSIAVTEIMEAADIHSIAAIVDRCRTNANEGNSSQNAEAIPA